MCGDEFNPRGMIRGAQWANRCNMCQEVDHEVETIQKQTERIINGQGAQRAHQALKVLRGSKV
jgi:predicted RNA-binding protein with PIN domain